MPPRSQSHWRGEIRNASHSTDVDTLTTEETMLNRMIALFQPYAAAIKADETGAEAERANTLVLEQLTSPEADWLFDNWDAVLNAL